jgi:hypothetical protein
MERAYWLDRQQQALVMAEASSDPEGQIVHIELARRYGLEAKGADAGSRYGRYLESAASFLPVVDVPG